jgi:hypothetical protein
MQAKWNQSLLAALILAIGVGIGWWASHGDSPTVQAAAEDKAAGTARYTVVQTTGDHIIVTDNQTNMLYFYAIEMDAAIGSDLKKRAELDLKQVGGKELKPKLYFTPVKPSKDKNGDKDKNEKDKNER